VGLLKPRRVRVLHRLGLVQTATSSAPIPTVRGRDVELAALGERLDRVRSGVGVVVLVEGAPGLGKTRLLAEGARIARRMSFRVGRGAAEPGETMVELAPLMSALFDGAEPLLEREALQALHALPAQRYWLLQDIQALLERAALEQPLLVCLDDLQWADSGTAAALRALPARLAALPIAWVLAARPNPDSIQLQTALEYLEREGAEKLVLRRLDEAAVAQVAVDVMRAEPDDALLELVKRAHGSPFLLMELLSGLRDEELVRVDSGHAELVEDRLPRRVSDSMRERLRGMSEPAREAATVAASLGRRFSFADLATMLDQQPSALLSPVEELVRFGVVIERDGKLAFRHDIIRDAVRASVPASARRALDRQAADVLLAAGATPVEVAKQLAASAEQGDELAIKTLLKAAEAVAMSDPGAGADLSRRGFELAPRRHPLRGPLGAQTALLLHEAARVDEARAFVDTSLREALPPEQEAEVRLSIAGMFAVSPDVRVEAGRKALALPDLPPALVARHLACLVHNLMVGGRSDEARSNLTEARAAATSSGDPNAAFMLNLAEGGLEAIAGRFEAALDVTEAAARAGSATHDYARERLAQEWRSELMMVLDRVEDSGEVAADGVAAAHRDRQGWAVHIFETWRGRQLLQSGRVPDAAAILEGQFSPEDEQRHEGILDVAGVIALGRIALHLGEARLQRMTAAFARVLVDQGPPSFRRQGAWLLALQAMAAGDPAGAHKSLCVLGEEERKSILPLFPVEVTDDTHLVRIAIAVNDEELATGAVAAAERRSELNPDASTIAAIAAHARGIATRDDGLLARAVELLDDGPRPLALASALEDLGAARVESGRAAEGIAALGRALTIYAQCGAAWDARRVRSRLRAQGVRRRLVTPERDGTGWAAMTDSELAVARLVAEGLTNREVAEQLFVSPHTVSSHLRRVFAKLEINSRVALTRLAGDEGRRS
jgi:DNA-binding CsgD family transcriptional regulator